MIKSSVYSKFELKKKMFVNSINKEQKIMSFVAMKYK